jgi:hypothetical protein
MIDITLSAVVDGDDKKHKSDSTCPGNYEHPLSQYDVHDTW